MNRSTSNKPIYVWIGKPEGNKSLDQQSPAGKFRANPLVTP
jgi:hypothetical protein